MKKCGVCGNDFPRLWKAKTRDRPAMCQNCAKSSSVSYDSGSGVRKHQRNSTIAHKARKSTGELLLFNKLWNERPHVSQVSGVPLGAFDIRLFSHICTKGAYPSLRLREDNIKMITKEEHDMWEFHRHKCKEDPRWDWVFKKYDELVYEYYNT